MFLRVRKEINKRADTAYVFTESKEEKWEILQVSVVRPCGGNVMGEDESHSVQKKN